MGLALGSSVDGKLVTSRFLTKDPEEKQEVCPPVLETHETAKPFHVAVCFQPLSQTRFH